MIIKDFNTFINERDGGLHKVICAVSSDLSDFIYVTGDAHTAYTRQFMTLFTRGVDSYAAKLPVVNYCNIHMQRMIKAGTPQDLIYNKEEETFEYRIHTTTTYYDYLKYDEEIIIVLF